MQEINRKYCEVGQETSCRK